MFIRMVCWEERHEVSYLPEAFRTEGVNADYLFRFELTGIRSVGMGRDEKPRYPEGRDVHR